MFACHVAEVGAGADLGAQIVGFIFSGNENVSGMRCGRRCSLDRKLLKGRSGLLHNPSKKLMPKTRAPLRKLILCIWCNSSQGNRCHCRSRHARVTATSFQFRLGG